jgi:hypothetical protein
MKARMPLQPSPDLRVFVSSVIVGNDVDVEFGRGFAIDGFERKTA